MFDAYPETKKVVLFGATSICRSMINYHLRAGNPIPDGYNINRHMGSLFRSNINTSYFGNKVMEIHNIPMPLAYESGMLPQLFTDISMVLLCVDYNVRAESFKFLPLIRCYFPKGPIVLVYYVMSYADMMRRPTDDEEVILHNYGVNERVYLLEGKFDPNLIDLKKVLVENLFMPEVNYPRVIR